MRNKTGTVLRDVVQPALPALGCCPALPAAVRLVAGTRVTVVANRPSDGQVLVAQRPGKTWPVSMPAADFKADE